MYSSTFFVGGAGISVEVKNVLKFGLQLHPPLACTKRSLYRLSSIYSVALQASNSENHFFSSDSLLRSLQIIDVTQKIARLNVSC